MNTNPEVDTWFAQLEHPLKPTMQRIREVILGADDRMREIVQYGTVQFLTDSGLCSFVQVKDRKRVSLMFNAAGRLKGTYPHLEGGSVKYMRFADQAAVDARADELAAIAREWCAGPGQPSRPSASRG